MLEQIGLEDLAPGEARIAVLVGPNGSGKSNFLRALALEIRDRKKNLLIISNTANDRFAGLRNIKRISASRVNGKSPKSVIKDSVAQTIDEPNSHFYQSGAILDYCGYRPRFGFQIVRPRKPPIAMYPQDIIFDNFDFRDFETSVAFLERYNSPKIIWVDQRESALSFSLAREIGAVLRIEGILRKSGYVQDIQVYLQRLDGTVIELHHASSGELTLISSLVFLATNVEDDSMILIDEPENSLHPSWQREYVDKVLASTFYFDTAIVIATHAPLVVTGALAEHSELVSIFQFQDNVPHALNLSEIKASAGNIEGILWSAFEVITPANHFVSEKLIEVLAQLERGNITEHEALSVVDEMTRHSFDEQQMEFFDAIRQLIRKVEIERQGNAPHDG
tara:strand:+ start:3461 stop:4639 length:1179 start_codon:yes stop_codon:yes gene_type:complete